MMFIDYNREWKAVKKQSFRSEPTCLTGHVNERRMLLPQELKCIFKSIGEFQAEVWAFLFVPNNSLFKFIRCTSVNSNLCQFPLALLRTRSRTSSGSSKLASPASISLIRRQSSISQARAASISAGPSRLATNSLARSARSVSGKERASLLTDSSRLGVLIWRSTGNLGFKILFGLQSHNKPLLPTQARGVCLRECRTSMLSRKQPPHAVRQNGALSRWEKLSVSSRVKVPVGKGLTSHPYRVLILLRSRVTDERNYKVSVHRVTCRP